MSTPGTNKAAGEYYWTDCYPERTPTQATWCCDACSAVKAPGSTTKLTLFDQSARKIGPPQRLTSNAQKTPATVHHRQHSVAKRVQEPGSTVTKPRSLGKHMRARLREDQENDLCRAFGAAVRVLSDPVQPHAKANTKQGTCEKPARLPSCNQQPPDTPSMYDSIRRYDFVKKALEESTNRDEQEQLQAQHGRHTHKAGGKDGSLVQQGNMQQSQQQEQEQLGRRDIYAAVRTNKATREEIGGNMALTPVRRSARKPHKSEREIEENEVQHDQDIAALLESTNYCYTPNKELTPLYSQQGGIKAMGNTEGKQLRF